VPQAASSTTYSAQRSIAVPFSHLYHDRAKAYLNAEFRPLSVYYAKLLNSQMDRQKEIGAEVAAAAAQT
jgi:hypothetical protein